eukprot:13152560-Alexandrium_andersonii.AAC.1
MRGQAARAVVGRIRGRRARTDASRERGSDRTDFHPGRDYSTLCRPEVQHFQEGSHRASKP